jgi:hypothetical protein
MNPMNTPAQRRRFAAGGRQLMQVLEIQGYSYEPSEALLRKLNRSLVNSGGWILDRRAITNTTYEVSLEFELRFIVDLYAAVIAAGVELTRCNHMAMTDICTCRLHLMGKGDMRQMIGMRIEISFLKQLTLHNLLMTGCSIA